MQRVSYWTLMWLLACLTHHLVVEVCGGKCVVESVWWEGSFLQIRGLVSKKNDATCKYTISSLQSES